MKKLEYVCDNCEDTEYWDKILKPGFHCERGGHLHLVLRDNFDELKGYSDCMRCSGRGTDDCIDCKRAPGNK